MKEDVFISSIDSDFSISSVKSEDDNVNDLLFFKSHQYFNKYENLEQIVPYIHKIEYKKNEKYIIENYVIN